MDSNKKVTSGFLWIYLENTSAQIVSFLVTIVLARLLEQTHYGTIALLTVFIALAQIFVTSGISSALIQKKDADELDYSTMFWFNLTVSLVLYFILFICAPSISNYYNRPELVLVLRVLAISIPLSAFNCIQQAYVSSHFIFKKSFISNSGGVIISGFVGILMAYLGYGLWALVAQRLVHVALNTVFLKLVISWYPKIMFSFERLKPMMAFGWRMMATGFLFTGYSQLRSLVIGKRYSAEDLGYYDRGFSFPNLIASNIDSSITRVLFPALSKYQDDADNLSVKSRRAAKLSAYIMTPLLWGLAIISKPLVALLLGDKWLPCVPYMQIMCIVWWLQPTQTCSAQAIKAIGRSDLYLKIELLSKAVGLILLAVAVFLFDSVIAIAFMYLAGQFAAVLIYGVYSEKYIGYKLKDQFVDLMVPAAMAFIACSVAYLLSYTQIGTINICIILQLFCVSGIYLCLSILFHNETSNYILKMLKNKR